VLTITKPDVFSENKWVLMEASSLIRLLQWIPRLSWKINPVEARAGAELKGRSGEGEEMQTKSNNHGRRKAEADNLASP
jgi:hypothetical protein